MIIHTLISVSCLLHSKVVYSRTELILQPTKVLNFKSFIYLFIFFYLFLHRGSSHTFHHPPETAIHEMGTLSSLQPPVLPHPGWPPGEGNRHPARRPFHFGPETLQPVHLGLYSFIRDTREITSWMSSKLTDLQLYLLTVVMSLQSISSVS